MVCRSVSVVTVLAAALACGSAPAPASGPSAGSLGGFPVCEASAALFVPCPGSGARCLLVGDNEERTGLFLYELDGEGRPGHRRDLAFDHLLPGDPGDRGLSDIEALAGLPSGEIAVFGSHSRNSECEAKGKRRQLLHARLSADRMEAGSVPPVNSKAPTCERLFGASPDDLEGPLAWVCAAVLESEESAEAAEREGSRDARIAACGDTPAFNLEGAVAVPAGAGSPRLWIGLRAPLVDRHAVLLRLAPEPGALRFDAAAFLDLGELGVRDLGFAEGFVWGIAGPPVDSPADHLLWRFPAGALATETVIAPTPIADLPTSAEGLAILDDQALVLIDGDAPDPAQPEVCHTDSTYLLVPLPD
jgi:hypothetical protein